jgi:hypothetical protein
LVTLVTLSSLRSSGSLSSGSTTRPNIRQKIPWCGSITNFHLPGICFNSWLTSS